MALMPNEVARLVHHYLLKEGYANAADSFVSECPHLKGLGSYSAIGVRKLPRIIGPTLIDLLEEYFEVKDYVVDELERLQCCDSRPQDSLLTLSKTLVKNLEAPVNGVRVTTCDVSVATEPADASCKDHCPLSCSELLANNCIDPDSSVNFSVILDRILEDRELHETIAEKINNRICNETNSGRCSDDIVKEIAQEADPVLENILQDFLTVENADLTTPTVSPDATPVVSPDATPTTSCRDTATPLLVAPSLEPVTLFTGSQNTKKVVALPSSSNLIADGNSRCVAVTKAPQLAVKSSSKSIAVVSDRNKHLLLVPSTNFVKNTAFSKVAAPYRPKRVKVASPSKSAKRRHPVATVQRPPRPIAPKINVTVGDKSVSLKDLTSGFANIPSCSNSLSDGVTAAVREALNGFGGTLTIEPNGSMEQLKTNQQTTQQPPVVQQPMVQQGTAQQDLASFLQSAQPVLEQPKVLRETSTVKRMAAVEQTTQQAADQQALIEGSDFVQFSAADQVAANQPSDFARQLNVANQVATVQFQFADESQPSELGQQSNIANQVATLQFQFAESTVVAPEEQSEASNDDPLSNLRKIVRKNLASKPPAEIPADSSDQAGAKERLVVTPANDPSTKLIRTPTSSGRRRRNHVRVLDFENLNPQSPPVTTNATSTLDNVAGAGVGDSFVAAARPKRNSEPWDSRLREAAFPPPPESTNFATPKGKAKRGKKCSSSAAKLVDRCKSDSDLKNTDSSVTVTIPAQAGQSASNNDSGGGAGLLDPSGGTASDVGAEQNSVCPLKVALIEAGPAEKIDPVAAEQTAGTAVEMCASLSATTIPAPPASAVGQVSGVVSPSTLFMQITTAPLQATRPAGSADAAVAASGGDSGKAVAGAVMAQQLFTPQKDYERCFAYDLGSQLSWSGDVPRTPRVVDAASPSSLGSFSLTKGFQYLAAPADSPMLTVPLTPSIGGHHDSASTLDTPFSQFSHMLGLMSTPRVEALRNDALESPSGGITTTLISPTQVIVRSSHYFVPSGERAKGPVSFSIATPDHQPESACKVHVPYSIATPDQQSGWQGVVDGALAHPNATPDHQSELACKLPTLYLGATRNRSPAKPAAPSYGVIADQRTASGRKSSTEMEPLQLEESLDSPWEQNGDHDDTVVASSPHSATFNEGDVTVVEASTPVPAVPCGIEKISTTAANSEEDGEAAKSRKSVHMMEQLFGEETMSPEAIVAAAPEPEKSRWKVVRSKMAQLFGEDSNMSSSMLLENVDPVQKVAAKKPSTSRRRKSATPTASAADGGSSDGKIPRRQTRSVTSQTSKTTISESCTAPEACNDQTEESDRKSVVKPTTSRKRKSRDNSPRRKDSSTASCRRSSSSRQDMIDEIISMATKDMVGSPPRKKTKRGKAKKKAVADAADSLPDAGDSLADKVPAGDGEQQPKETSPVPDPPSTSTSSHPAKQRRKSCSPKKSPVRSKVPYHRSKAISFGLTFEGGRRKSECGVGDGSWSFTSDSSMSSVSTGRATPDCSLSATSFGSGRIILPPDAPIVKDAADPLQGGTGQTAAVAESNIPADLSHPQDDSGARSTPLLHSPAKNSSQWAIRSTKLNSVIEKISAGRTPAKNSTEGDFEGASAAPEPGRPAPDSEAAALVVGPATENNNVQPAVLSTLKESGGGVVVAQSSTLQVAEPHQHIPPRAVTVREKIVQHVTNVRNKLVLQQFDMFSQ